MHYYNWYGMYSMVHIHTYIIQYICLLILYEKHTNIIQKHIDYCLVRSRNGCKWALSLSQCQHWELPFCPLKVSNKEKMASHKKSQNNLVPPIYALSTEIFLKNKLEKGLRAVWECQVCCLLKLFTSDWSSLFSEVVELCAACEEDHPMGPACVKKAREKRMKEEKEKGSNVFFWSLYIG